MLESAELGREISKDEYEALVPRLRVDLINTQYDFLEVDAPVFVVLAGNDRSGCDEVLDVLHEWMDARHLETHAFGPPTQEEGERPRFWRYWRALPPFGRISVVLGAWSLSAVANRARGQTDDAHFEGALARIRRFERALVHDGALLLKFWLHLPKKEFKKRLKKAKKNPDRDWLVNEEDWEVYDRYDRALPLVERMLSETTGRATPWELVESSNSRYRNLTVARGILTSLRHRLDHGPTDPETGTDGDGPAPLPPGPGALSTVDLTASLSRAEYKERLGELQARLNRLSRQAHRAGLSTVLVFEGWDAGGKGGAIRRLTQAMTARHYRVVQIAAPTPQEKRYHYLWRFWQHLPRAGLMRIFDRSWYGRVMVERVEGFATPAQWQRAFEEINDFEEQLVDRGIVLRKFWLQIDADEQLRRFKLREKTSYKKYKITEEDYRNRERWADYEIAVNEMIARTGTSDCPWVLVAANDKRWARIQVLETVCEALDGALALSSESDE